MRQPEAFRAVTRFSPPPPAGGAPSQRGPGSYERSRRHAQALPQAARGYRLLPLCSPHGAARAPAPPCTGAARCGPGGAGPGRRAAGAADGFPRRAAGRPRGGAPRPGSHGPAATRDALADTQRADASAHTTPETAAVPAAAADEILPRYRALYEKNPDLIGWLRIDGTDIDLPVVQTPGDNEYYLRRGFDRFYAVGGTLFLDERCSVSADAPTANWLIYGHNMHDGSMFGQLVRYRDEDFYKAHPTFTFDTLYEGGTWQVVAAVDTALGADALPYYTFFDADNKLDWQHRVRAITEKALYDTGVMPEYGAQLLTLSTCGDTHPDTDARFALLAVRID